MVYGHFKAENRIHVSLESLKFGVLTNLFAKGQDYMSDLAAAQERAKARKQKAWDRRGGGRGKGSERSWGDTLAQRQP